MKKYIPVILLLFILGVIAGDGFQRKISKTPRPWKSKPGFVGGQFRCTLFGLSHIGFQALEIRILNGDFKGKEIPAVNSLSGQTDIENLFKPDDVIIAALIMENGAIDQVKAVELFRQDTIFILFGFFVTALLIYAGAIG